MGTLPAPPIVRAAQSSSILRAALAYAELGLSVVSLWGKRPTVPWRDLQKRATCPTTIWYWHSTGLLHNVGLICGTASQHLVVLDLDSPESYAALTNTFPTLIDTYTVATGSGHGYHLYWYVTSLPRTLRVLGTPLGNLELRANGCQVVAPPSLHPVTRQPYVVARAAPIRTLPDLMALTKWIYALSGKSWAPRLSQRDFQAYSRRRITRSISPQLLSTLTTHFESRGFKQHGDWLNGPCICPDQHRHGDVHPSFGFNTCTGYGYCFVCGTFLIQEICAIVGVSSTTNDR